MKLNAVCKDNTTVVPTKSASDVMLCLELLSKTFTLHSIWANANQ